MLEVLTYTERKRRAWDEPAEETERFIKSLRLEELLIDQRDKTIAGIIQLLKEESHYL